MLVAIGLAAVWLGVAVVAHLANRASVREGDWFCGLVILVMRLFARWVHGLRVVGLEHVPRAGAGTGSVSGVPRPLVIVANHTAFIDPLLIQAALPFEVRWIMGADMASPVARRFWEYARVILVDRRVNESAPLREAIRHVKEGGAIGIFPEGFIERPPRVVFPFKEGVGLVVSRTASGGTGMGAVVLPVVIDGTPQVEPGGRALLTASRSTVRFLPVRDYAGKKMGAAEIAADLRRVFVEATGWPESDLTPVWEDGAWTDVGLDGRRYRGGVVVE